MGGTAPGPFHRAPLAARWRIRAAEPGSDAPSSTGPGWIDASAPQTVAATLRDAGLWSIDGPARDFDAQDWWYEARFDAVEGADALCFDGLATLSQAWLNDAPLLRSESMFLAHSVPVGGQLRAGENLLALRFAALAPELARRRPRPRWRTPMVAHQQLRWLRTTLLGRTPGWSPPVAPVGPWRAIAWASSDECTPQVTWGADDRQGWCEVRLPDGPWRRDVEAAHVVLIDPAGREQVQLPAGSGGSLLARFVVQAPVLWWPHTHGDPALYQLRLRLVTRGGARHDHALGRLGFRTVTIDQGGGGFALRVNGERVFCRGGGWTPLDPVSLRSTPAQCRASLLQLRDTGANMLRLAGTLPPEEPHFYALCDELGLLVWQDFAFASMDYPFADGAFEAVAAREVRQQARRLAGHACVAVLCGNSEVEQQAAMWGVGREGWRIPFFDATAASICGEEAPGAAYWPSSAHGGAFPHAADAGTTSYYGVGAYERPIEDARRSGLRFATECLAFACVPDGAGLARMPGGLSTRVHHPAWKARSPRDLGAGWDFDDVRDHYVRELFGEDPARLRHADHDRYLALGRSAVGEVMGLAFAEWRRAGSDCGGALLLQLRDLWAGAGWGVLDEQGHPKSAFHALRRAWAPVAVFCTDEGGNGLVAHAANDTGNPVGATLHLECWRDGDLRVAQACRPLHLPARSTLALPLVDLLDHFMDLNHAWRFGPPACELVALRLRDNAGAELARAVHFPVGIAPLAAARRRELGLHASVVATAANEARLSVRTQQWAIGVQVDMPGWIADDDHFHLLPGEVREVVLRCVLPGAPLAGSLHALNLSTPLPIEAAP